MITSEVQRTLVKSPPELWAELSDPQALARHLGELGEIRITRAEPEKLVEWEAQEARGSVAIKASGWGTKVTLKASRDYTAPAIDTSEPAPAKAGEAVQETTAEVAQAEITAEPELAAEPESSGLDDWTRQEADVAGAAAETEPVDEIEPVADVDAPEPKMGFFARLFGRRRRSRAVEPEFMNEPDPVDEPALMTEPEPIDEPTPASEPEAAEETAPMTEPGLLDQPATATEPDPIEEPVLNAEVEVQGTPADERDSEPAVSPAEAEEEVPAVDLAAELKAAEEAAEEEVTAILKSVLDRLGAAHHRPFSRS